MTTNWLVADFTGSVSSAFPNAREFDSKEYGGASGSWGDEAGECVKGFVLAESVDFSSVAVMLFEDGRIVLGSYFYDSDESRNEEVNLGEFVSRAKAAVNNWNAYCEKRLATERAEAIVTREEMEAANRVLSTPTIARLEAFRKSNLVVFEAVCYGALAISRRRLGGDNAWVANFEDMLAKGSVTGRSLRLFATETGIVNDRLMILIAEKSLMYAGT
jgi:hypothetical protein